MKANQLTPEELAAIRARESKATPGPWRVFNMATPEEPMQSVKAGSKEVALFCTGDFAQAQEDANAEFSAEARTDIPRLLATVEALQAESCPPLSSFSDGEGDADTSCSACGEHSYDPHPWRHCAEVLSSRAETIREDLDDTKARLASHVEAIFLASKALGNTHPGFSLAQNITMRLRELQAENERLRAENERLAADLDGFIHGPL